MPAKREASSRVNGEGMRGSAPKSMAGRTQSERAKGLTKTGPKSHAAGSSRVRRQRSRDHGPPIARPPNGLQTRAHCGGRLLAESDLLVRGVILTKLLGGR